MTQYQLTLNSPMTKEDWSKITDANMEHTKSVTFQTEGGKCVEFVKVVRCKDCKWWDGRTWDEKGEPLYGYCNACKHGHYSSNWEISIFRKYKADWFCADGERREDKE